MAATVLEPTDSYRHARGDDWPHRFPAVAAAARDLDVHTAILDGEAVVLDDNGRSDFGALQRSVGGRGGKRVSAPSSWRSTCSISTGTTSPDRNTRCGAICSRMCCFEPGMKPSSFPTKWRSRGTSPGAGLPDRALRHHRRTPGSALSIRPDRPLAEDQTLPERKLRDHRI